MSASADFTVTQPTRIRFGCGAISDLADMVRECGGSKVFLVADPGLEAAGLLERIIAPLEREKIAHELYTAIDPEPGLLLADKGAELARQAGADCVVVPVAVPPWMWPRRSVFC